MVVVVLILFCAGIDSVHGQDDFSSGVRLMELGEYQSAIRSFNNIISRGIDDVASYIATLERREEAYRLSGQHQLAISDCTELIRVINIYTPDFPDINWVLANLFCRRGKNYQSLGRFVEAMNDYNRSIQILPNVLAYEYRAKACAEKYMDILVILDGEGQTMGANTWNQYIELKNSYYTSAYSDFQSALRIDPNDRWVREGLGILELIRTSIDIYY
jgi:tetratricopeptide (TPR) repeat protein